VADTDNHRIQQVMVSVAHETFVRQGGTLGTGAGQFDSPGGVAADATGNVYVADTDNHRVQQFLCGPR
jgi:DNA-binding beta-propeller fold protein YncE